MARDLALEAKDLSRRAQVLERRAPDSKPMTARERHELAKAKAEADAAKANADTAKSRAKAEKAKADEAVARQRHADLELKREKAAAAGPDALKDFNARHQEMLDQEAKESREEVERKKAASDKPPLDFAIGRLKSAQGSIETARKNVDGATLKPDAVAASFTCELDVLAEMSLGLRRRCGEVLP
jgi:hypothetical protein